MTGGRSGHRPGTRGRVRLSGRVKSARQQRHHRQRDSDSECLTHVHPLDGDWPAVSILANGPPTLQLSWRGAHGIPVRRPIASSGVSREELAVHSHQRFRLFGGGVRSLRDEDDAHSTEGLRRGRTIWRARSASTLCDSHDFAQEKQSWLLVVVHGGSGVQWQAPGIHRAADEGGLEAIVVSPSFPGGTAGRVGFRHSGKQTFSRV